MTLDVTSEVTGLLQELIRAGCVNDGTPESGHERRAVDVIADHLSGLPAEVFEPVPGRQSLLVRLEGSDPSAPTLLLMGHTDVVPVTPSGWRRDPMGGELVDGWVWGRGAIDMLNLTASMAVATRRLAATGRPLRGTLLYLAVADEEAGGTHGAEWLTRHHADQVRADWVVTESGGIPLETPSGTRLWTVVGEKGVAWTRIVVRGRPGHGSRPLGTDNAVVKAAEAVRRLATHRPRPMITDVWRGWVEGMGFEPDVAAALVDPDRIWEGLDRLPPHVAATAHATTHLTCAPTVAHGGTKTNVIPDRVVLEVDMRKVPGQTDADVDRFLRDALGDLWDSVEVEPIRHDAPTVSPTGTPLWEAMTRASAKLRPGTTLLPTLTTGGTDARFFREMDIPAYGFGLYSERMTLEQWSGMFHGNDERVDQDSLRLTAELWEELARDLLG